jgi:hypothetical protein
MSTRLEVHWGLTIAIELSQTSFAAPAARRFDRVEGNFASDDGTVRSSLVSALDSAVNLVDRPPPDGISANRSSLEIWESGFQSLRRLSVFAEMRVYIVGG